MGEAMSSMVPDFDRALSRSEPRPAFWLRVDDVMSCIAASYERHLGRQASYAEVKERYNEIGAGTDLTTILASIASSEEAQTFSSKRERPKDDREAFSVFLDLLYWSALGRQASSVDVDDWFGAYRGGMDHGDVVRCVCTSTEAKSYRFDLAPENVSDGRFVQLCCDLVLERGATAAEVARSGEDAQAHARFPYRRPDSSDPPLISIITSLYAGGRYIEAFLENITSQSIFDDCELIIVDAASPDGEREAIEAAAQAFPNIVYLRLETRVGIYAAWNMAVARARGSYLTNANLDDCRRRDSIELQAATLQALPFVDIVHQDVVFSLEPNLPFDAIAAVDFRTAFPNANAYSLLDINAPHNAPMWRRRLHEEIGIFDETLVSAADFDFWLRCASRGKRFYKLNDPHVGYYYNPHGLSTRADTPGHREVKAITRRHAASLVAAELTMTPEAFESRLRALGVQPSGGYDRAALLRAALLATAEAFLVRYEERVA